jgi:fengycin family lipopeptide synthetase D/tyrocidine synthetase-3
LDADIEIFSGLRNLLVGGEALSPIHINLARSRFPRLTIINGYGPTENTTFSCTYQVNTEHEKNIPIGKPIANSTSYIVDKYNYLAPVGIVGELLVGGDGVARGYLNNPGLTAEKFCLRRARCFTGRFLKKLPRETSAKNFLLEGTRGLAPLLYRTGDLAKWLPDGNIEFLGRIDRQVKIRGFRIEPGEIEKRLMELSAIKKAVVIVREKRDKEKYLCAYVAAARELNISQLKTFLSLNVPSHMIPSYFVKIEKIPLTPNGKIDYNALPSPKVKSGDEYEAPQDEIEKKLLGIWSKVLEIETHIGTNDNFFELGGHSLKAAMLVSEIHRQFNITVPLLEVFVAPTIKQFAQYIRITDTKSFTIKDENLELLRKKSDTANHLFFVHDGTGQVEGYIELCNHLNSEFNCWGIRADRLKNYAPQNITIQELAKKYTRKIKKIQPQGPYFIIGWSLGGTIAFEMTCQLEYSGEKPGFLVLIDTTPPASDSLTTRTKFSGKSELNVIYTWLKRKEIKQQLKNANEITQIWQQVVDYLEKRAPRKNLWVNSGSGKFPSV